MMIEIILGLVGLAVGLYYYLTKDFNYWEVRGVKGPKPSILYGTVKDVMWNKLTMGDYLRDVYNEWKNEPFVGIYLRQSPLLVINDLDVVKDVLIKDFSKFADRGNLVYEKIEPLGAHLFNLEPTRWRPLRLKLSPVFTSGKLREMFYLLVDCADHLDTFLKDKIQDSKEGTIMECRDFTAKFTTDVIGVCAFGLQMNAMSSEDSEFRKMGKRIFQVDFLRILKFRLRTLSPTLFQLLGPLLADTEMNDFFINITKDTMDYRKKNNIVRHDFIDLLMAIKDHPDKMADIELTDSLLAAQLFVFFIAGFETSSTTMSHALYELALNTEIQDKLRDEINEEMKRTGGIIEYEGIKNLKYLNMVFEETLRKYPPVTILMRRATEDYTFNYPSKNRILNIKKGQKVWIPNFGIQMDPQYFPEPEIFDPERFTDEAVKTRNPLTTLAFGDGPRNCVGKRFGVMQTKVGLVKILQNYRVDRCEKTQVPYLSNPKAFLLAPKDGIYLRITRLSKTMTEL